MITLKKFLSHMCRVKHNRNDPASKWQWFATTLPDGSRVDMRKVKRYTFDSTAEAKRFYRSFPNG